MAYTDFWLNEDGSRGDNMYVVTHAVGTNAPNKRDDVLLVQYMLKKVYEKGGTRLSRPVTKMVVDGYFGPITKSWILMFQNDVKRAGFSIWVDGRVDPSTGDTRGTISKQIYTIIHLDNSFKHNFPEIHANMANHLDVPAEVRASLAQSA